MTEIEAPEKEPLLLERPAAAAGAVEIGGPGDGSATADPSGAGIAVREVSKAFTTRRGQITALLDVSFELAPMEVVGVVGPSGCGKSTLLELISGLEQCSSGEIHVNTRRDPRERLGQCALMPQRDLLLPWRSALDNAGLALEFGGMRRADARARVAPLFERFGLAGFEQTPPRELSGGMRQRVAFLRTLVAGKPVLLLDEPFGALDTITRAGMQEWLSSALLASPHTVLVVTHDTEEALFLCDRVLVLSPRPGRVEAEIEVDLPRPRPRRETVTSSRFVALKQQALEALG